MTKVLVVYHSRSGNTAKMAAAVAEGARNGGAEAVLKKFEEATLEDLTGADGIVLGAPTYFGTLSGEMKGFIDRSVRVRGRLEDKIGAAFTSSGSPTGGNETTLISIIEAMLIHGMVIVGDPRDRGPLRRRRRRSPRRLGPDRLPKARRAGREIREGRRDGLKPGGS